MQTLEDQLTEMLSKSKASEVTLDKAHQFRQLRIPSVTSALPLKMLYNGWRCVHGHVHIQTYTHPATYCGNRCRALPTETCLSSFVFLRQVTD